MLLQPVHAGCPCKSLISAGISDTKDARLKGGDVCPVSLMPSEEGNVHEFKLFFSFYKCKAVSLFGCLQAIFTEVNRVWGGDRACCLGETRTTLPLKIKVLSWHLDS